jgi:hypothetical protein
VDCSYDVSLQCQWFFQKSINLLAQLIVGSILKSNQFSDSLVAFAGENLKLRGAPSSILDISLQYGYFSPNAPITIVGFLPAFTSNRNMDYSKAFIGL